MAATENLKRQFSLSPTRYHKENERAINDERERERERERELCTSLMKGNSIFRTFAGSTFSIINPNHFSCWQHASLLACCRYFLASSVASKLCQQNIKCLKVSGKFLSSHNPLFPSKPSKKNVMARNTSEC
jgi:hypothetical protein